MPISTSVSGNRTHGSHHGGGCQQALDLPFSDIVVLWEYLTDGRAQRVVFRGGQQRDIFRHSVCAVSYGNLEEVED